jgi:cytochrome c556
MATSWISRSILFLAFILTSGACSRPPEQARYPEVRTPVVLERSARDSLLAEMRTMMVSVDGIAQGIAADDCDATARAARAAGMRGAVDDSPGFREMFPHEFRELGLRTHRRFDALADQMQQGASTRDAMKGLAELTGNCVGCHATYRVALAVVPVSKYGPVPKW